MIHKILKGLAPVAALAAGAMLSGCNVDMKIGDSDGVPLAELDMGGEAPSEIVLAGPDTVVVARGETFDIDVSGDADVTDTLRFSRDGDALAISRENGVNMDGAATVRVTVPSLKAMVLAGSGRIEAEEMTGRAEVTIAGSGKAIVSNMEADSLDLTIAGSGDFETSGTAESLDMTVAGSGSGKMGGLKVDRADITVAGSGNAEFASDGRVEASIVGSGDITVNGSATCEVSAMGSGKLRCSAGATENAAS